MYIYTRINEFFYFILLQFILCKWFPFLTKFPGRVEDIISRWKFKFFNDFRIEYPTWWEWRNYKTFETRRNGGFSFFLFPFLFFMYVIYQILYAQGTREIAVSRPCFTFLSYTSSFVRNLSLNSFQIDDFHPQILSLSRLKLNNSTVEL